MPPAMRIPTRAVVIFCALLGTALVVGAAASSLYDYTDDELSGPEQPIQFSHAVHTSNLGIECLYCHTTADKGQHATIPAVSVCMGCHQWVKEGASPGSAEEIAKLHDFYERGESIPWQKIHNLPEHVQFKHFRHARAGVECQTCHGPVESMNRVWLVPDTVLRPSSLFLPAAKLEMGWCMNCHLERGAADDCLACHY
jgi:hypothetical protein